MVPRAYQKKLAGYAPGMVYNVSRIAKYSVLLDLLVIVVLHFRRQNLFNTKLTERGFQRMISFLAPPHRVQVCRVCVKPFIVDIVPAVVMNPNLVLLHVGNGGRTYQGRVPSVDCLQFHHDLETGQDPLK